MLSPKLDALGVRPLEAADAAELYAVVEANRDHLAPWMPWAAGQDLAATEKFIAEAEVQLASNDGFQAAISPQGRIVGVAGAPWSTTRSPSGTFTASRSTAPPPTAAAAPSPSASASAKKQCCERPSWSAAAGLMAVVYGLLEGEWGGGKSVARA